MNEIKDMMLEDSKDFLDSVEVTTIALECKKLKQKEDEVASLEEQLKNKRKSKEKEKRAKDEKGLEKGPKLGGKIKMPKLPGKGLIDKIFGFIGTIVFGWLALKLVDWMPTLENILPKLGMAADWVIGAGIWIVDALANVIIEL